MAGSKLTISKLLLGVILTVLALTMFVPIANLLAKALSEPSKVHLLHGYEIWPRGFSLINFKVVFNNPLIGRALMNSLFITIVGTLSSVFFTTISAYVLTRKNLVGKAPLMIFLIIIMIFEPGIVQEYMVVKQLHLLDSLWVMVLYRTINVYYLIIMMRFIEDIPDSLMEAARIDGAGHMTVFTRIVLPSLACRFSQSGCSTRSCVGMNFSSPASSCPVVTILCCRFSLDSSLSKAIPLR